MSDLVSRDVEYTHDGDRMVGYLCAPAADRPRGTVLLVHDAFGLGPDTVALAHRVARLGLTVFAADVWGDRTLPASDAEIGPLIGGMVADRARWTGRVAAAQEAAVAQPEATGDLVGLGHCFGGSALLEHLRVGGDLRAVAAIHPGLDLLDGDWSTPVSPTSVLVCVGADDPMATEPMRHDLESALTRHGVDWQTHVYSGTVHAFTSPGARHSPAPDVVAYHPRSAARAWAATTQLLAEALRPDGAPA
ncbi:MAG TPA: dienelactone hydrolase family protein [Luteimicrobium sp.]|nr:dienelactone hydrolase family protein [Luteimicrobium sp.]